MSPSIGDLSTPASPSQRVTDPTLDWSLFLGAWWCCNVVAGLDCLSVPTEYRKRNAMREQLSFGVSDLTWDWTLFWIVPDFGVADFRVSDLRVSDFIWDWTLCWIMSNFGVTDLTVSDLIWIGHFVG
jgi:hypothetical protein